MSLWLAALGHVMWAASVRWPSHAARAVRRVVNDREGQMDIYCGRDNFVVFDTVNKR